MWICTIPCLSFSSMDELVLMIVPHPCSSLVFQWFYWSHLFLPHQSFASEITFFFLCFTIFLLFWKQKHRSRLSNFLFIIIPGYHVYSPSLKNVIEKVICSYFLYFNYQSRLNPGSRRGIIHLCVCVFEGVYVSICVCFQGTHSVV